MGGLFSASRSKYDSRSRKRPLDLNSSSDAPVKKRIRSTYDYIYRELFCKGEGSDITVKSLDHEWMLHRLYIKQSPFFSAMLEGGWKESGCNTIELELSDPNITQSSLNTVFGSFYRDSVYISENSVLSLLATATWFHMEDIRNLCSEFMERRVCLRNVIDFFLISKQYNLPGLSKRSVKWIAENLLLLEEGEILFDLLWRIPVDLMTEVVSKPDLTVVQLEQDVFLMLLKWVFLKQHTDYEFQQSSRLLDDAYSFFTSEGQSFLETPEGLRYAPAFQAIRWEYVINVYKTTERMMRDRVVPEAWLGKVFCQQWLRLLHTHELQTQYTRSSNIGHGHSSSSSTGATSDSANNASRIRVTLTGRESTLPIPAADALRVEEPGPRSDLPEDVFWATSERCGRRMHNGDTTCSWRWTGFHFGFDVVVKYKRRTFSIIRFTESHSTEGSISHAPHLRLMISLRVKPLTPTGHETTNSPDDLDTLVDVVNEPVEKSGDQDSESCITSGVLRLSLEENVLVDVLRLPDHFVFPAVVAANILRYDPIGWIPITNTAFREDA